MGGAREGGAYNNNTMPHTRPHSNSAQIIPRAIADNSVVKSSNNTPAFQGSVPNFKTFVTAPGTFPGRIV